MSSGHSISWSPPGVFRVTLYVWPFTDTPRLAMVPLAWWHTRFWRDSGDLKLLRLDRLEMRLRARPDERDDEDDSVTTRRAARSALTTRLHIHR